MHHHYINEWWNRSEYEIKKELKVKWREGYRYGFNETYFTIRMHKMHMLRRQIKTKLLHTLLKNLCFFFQKSKRAKQIKKRKHVMKYYIINILGCVAYGTENWVGGEFFFFRKEHVYICTWHTRKKISFKAIIRSS